MAILVTELFSRMDDLLLDFDRVRWTESERLRWANEAMGAILTRRPQAFSRREVVPLLAGASQSIPTGGAMLLDVVRNMGANGTTPGRAIRRTSRTILDDGDRDWYSRTPSDTIKNFTFDERLPQGFYVYPPAVAGTQVEMVYTRLPVVVTDSAAGSLDIGTEYMEAVVNYVCYRCNSKDSEYANGNMAAGFYQAFEASLGIKSQTEVAASPNQQIGKP
jgi:hypothetical protein